jgi:hypothetical protein
MIQRNTPHRQRPTVADGPIGQQLAGGVVHRGDVVGVEGVPQAERVSQYSDPDGVNARFAQVEPLGNDEEQEEAEADDVEGKDESGHSGNGAPVLWRKGGPHSRPQGMGHGRQRRHPK